VKLVKPIGFGFSTSEYLSTSKRVLLSISVDLEPRLPKSILFGDLVERIFKV